MSARILVVEDEQAIADSLAYALDVEGFEVDVVSDGSAAIESARVRDYDLMLLDLMLPGTPGLEVCRAIRAEADLPILILTARDAEVDRVLGLEVGADDYVTKPFSMRELVSRIRAILRRRQLDRAASPATREIGELRIDLFQQAVRVGSRSVELTPSEFRLLVLLASEPERAFTRREIVSHLWRSTHVADDRVCDVHIKNLRRKVELDPARPRRIVTVRGVGYMLRAR
jgi:two-component system response regulator RegX3